MYISARIYNLHYRTTHCSRTLGVLEAPRIAPRSLHGLRSVHPRRFRRPWQDKAALSRAPVPGTRRLQRFLACAYICPPLCPSRSRFVPFSVPPSPRPAGTHTRVPSGQPANARTSRPLQLSSVATMAPLRRWLGRVQACGPTMHMSQCGDAGVPFDVPPYLLPLDLRVKLHEARPVPYRKPSNIVRLIRSLHFVWET